MQLRPLAGALAFGVSVVSPFTFNAALADDPNDPAMRSPAARAKDRAIISQLNADQAAYVRERDARRARGWAAHKAYPAQQAEYARRMAEWRRAVRLCESGRHEYCAP